MATSTLEYQLQSAQKNLLFLQREHANTLKGLHAELRRLQQRCTGTHTLLAITASTSVKPQQQSQQGAFRVFSLYLVADRLIKAKFFYLFFKKLIVRLFSIFADLQ